MREVREIKKGVIMIVECEENRTEWNIELEMIRKNLDLLCCRPHWHNDLTVIILPLYLRLIYTGEDGIMYEIL